MESILRTSQRSSQAFRTNVQQAGVARGQAPEEGGHSAALADAADLGLLEDDSMDTTVIVRSGSSLTSMMRTVGKFTESSTATLVIMPLLNALKQLHGKGITHGHVRPSTIFLDSDNKLRLMDPCSAAQAGKAAFAAKPDAWEYMAPELRLLPASLNDADLAHSDQPAVDVWACGALAYELLVGQLPLQQELDHVPCAPDQDSLAAELVLPQQLSPAACSFLKSALCKDPNLRPTARQLLKHAWIQRAAQAGTLQVRRSQTTSSLIAMPPAGDLSSPGAALRPYLPRRTPSSFVDVMSTLASARSYHRGFMRKSSTECLQTVLDTEAEPELQGPNSVSSPLSKVTASPARGRFGSKSWRASNDMAGSGRFKTLSSSSPEGAGSPTRSTRAAQWGSASYPNSADSFASGAEPAAAAVSSPQLELELLRPEPPLIGAPRSRFRASACGSIRSMRDVQPLPPHPDCQGDEHAGSPCSPPGAAAAAGQSEKTSKLPTLQVGKRLPSRGDSWPILVAGLEARQDAIAQLWSLKP